SCLRLPVPRLPLSVSTPSTAEIYTLSLHDALPISGTPAHVVVRGRLNRNGLARDVDACENARRLRDSRQPLVDHVGAEVLEVQRSEEHTSELQSRENSVCRMLFEEKKSHMRVNSYR